VLVKREHNSILSKAFSVRLWHKPTAGLVWWLQLYVSGFLETNLCSWWWLRVLKMPFLNKAQYWALQHRTYRISIMHEDLFTRHKTYVCYSCVVVPNLPYTEQIDSVNCNYSLYLCQYKKTCSQYKSGYIHMWSILTHWSFAVLVHDSGHSSVYILADNLNSFIIRISINNAFEPDVTQVLTLDREPQALCSFSNLSYVI